MPACRACAGYRGATWWVSRPCATPEETLTCWLAALGCATGMSLATPITLFAVPPGTEPDTSAALSGGWSSVLTAAVFFGTGAGSLNTASSGLLAGFAGGAAVGATLWSFGLDCLSVCGFALESVDVPG